MKKPNIKAFFEKKFEDDLAEHENIYDLIDYETAAYSVDDSAISCGVCQLSAIKHHKATALVQGLILWGLLHSYAFVILSDVAGSKAWKETKKFSLSTGSRKNPNTGNQIKVYIADMNTVKRLIGYK